MRKEFVLTDAQHKRLIDACRPVPYMVAGGYPPASPQENANAAWAALGRELGFDGMTVQPVPGKSDRYFTAVVVDPPRAATEGRMKPEKTYLGDGAYAEFDGWMLKLTTQRAESEHVIYLEPAVYDALVRYARTCGWTDPRP